MENKKSVKKVIEVPLTDVKKRRMELIMKIEHLTKSLIVDQISQFCSPNIRFCEGKNWGFHGEVANDDGEVGIFYKVSKDYEKAISFIGMEGRQRFSLILTVLAHIHEKLIAFSQNANNQNFFSTRRSYYYELKNKLVGKFIDKQSILDYAINQICMMLDCGPWEIGFISTAKGLVAGDLKLELNNGTTIIYDMHSHQTVPKVVANITKIITSVEFVLVIEKDSVFQKLLSEGCPQYHNCILITGKGYPDIPTRMLVHILGIKVELPVYALVDPNPYGFEIMCTYRFGSMNQVGFREQLVCPTLHWLGVHPKDLTVLGIPRMKLSDSDKKKLEQIEKRPYMNTHFMDHLTRMKFGKAEIESINKPISNFLSRHYISSKLRNKEYI